MAKKQLPAKSKRKAADIAIATPKHRKVKQPKYKSFKVSKRIRQPKAPLKNAFKLFATSLRLLTKKWRLFGGIVIIYLLLTIMLVKGFGVSSNIGQLKNALQGLSQGNLAQLSTGLSLFSVLLGNANSTSSPVAGAYQSMLLIVISLVLIWALRSSLADKKIRIRDTFYKSLTPLIPFLLVLMVIGLQLIPMVVANFLYTAVIGGGLAVTTIEKGLWIILILLLMVLSLYMITSSIFALYIVTLPNVTPMQALRSARELVRYRRWMIMRKVLFLPVAILILAAIIVVPVILISAPVAEWLFFVLSMLVLAVAHSYMYHLYRELL